MADRVVHLSGGLVTGIEISARRVAAKELTW
jgi:hypothetical protein